RLHNLYGPTEAAVDVTFHEVTDADTTSVPIGAPVFNTQVYVLDARLRGGPPPLRLAGGVRGGGLGGPPGPHPAAGAGGAAGAHRLRR
uniref:AMP-binding protein n=1 Tax=Nocardia cyriacigeorgica TaxID=135487 RepID=UPI0024555E70